MDSTFKAWVPAGLIAALIPALTFLMSTTYAWAQERSSGGQRLFHISAKWPALYLEAAVVGIGLSLQALHILYSSAASISGFDDKASEDAIVAHSRASIAGIIFCFGILGLVVSLTYLRQVVLRRQTSFVHVQSYRWFGGAPKDHLAGFDTACLFLGYFVAFIGVLGGYVLITS